MFISQLELSTPGTRIMLRDIRNPYEMHRTIWKAFPNNEDGGPGRVLFRLEWKNSPIILVQSEKTPNWNNLPDRKSVV